MPGERPGPPPCRLLDRSGPPTPQRVLEGPVTGLMGSIALALEPVNCSWPEENSSQ